jgi:hypothetical protein
MIYIHSRHKERTPILYDAEETVEYFFSNKEHVSYTFEGQIIIIIISYFIVMKRKQWKISIEDRVVTL